jgi:hypothetical protein
MSGGVGSNVEEVTHPPGLRSGPDPPAMGATRERITTMSEFVLLFRATETEQREAMGTPERAQKSMQAWLAWIRDLVSRVAGRQGFEPR